MGIHIRRFCIQDHIHRDRDQHQPLAQHQQISFRSIIGVWVSSISVMSGIAKAISSVQEIGISISLWLSLWLSSGKSGTADHKSKLHHVENLRVQVRLPMYSALIPPC